MQDATLKVASGPGAYDSSIFTARVGGKVSKSRSIREARPNRMTTSELLSRCKGSPFPGSS
jgi:hypothetical protein